MTNKLRSVIEELEKCSEVSTLANNGYQSEEQNPIKWIEIAIEKIKNTKESEEVKCFKLKQAREELSSL